MRVKLGDCVKQIRGVSYKPSDLHDRLDDYSIPLLRANNIQNGQVTFDNLIYVSKEKVRYQQYLKKGDILICTSSGSKELVGKAAYIEQDLQMTFGAFCKVVRPIKGDAKYISYFFQSPRYRKDISNLASGANINNIRNEHIENILLSFPPLDEQRRIAAVLDKVSDLIAKRQAQLDKLDELVKSRFVEMFGDPEHNNKNWEIVPLSTVCSVSSSKRIYQNEQSSQGIPFLRISDLTNLINTGTFTTNLYIPEKKYEELQSKNQVPKSGDILVTSRGTLGQCYIIKDYDKFYFQDGMISWLSTFKDNITPLYLSYLFAMPGFQKQIDKMQAGSTVAYLSITMIRKLKVMVPDIKKQQDFAKFIKGINSFKSVLTQSLTQLQILKKVIMQKHFE